VSGFRAVTRRLLAYSQYGFPFLPGGASSPVGRMRRQAARVRLPKRRLLRPLVFAAMLFTWPIGALYTAIRLERRGGLRRVVDAWRLALTRNVPPFEYRAYRLDRPEARAALAHYVFWTDLPAIAALSTRQGANPRDVQDKTRFSELCGAHGLPAIPTLALFRGGEQIFPPAPFVPGDAELWVKSPTGSGGQGAASWRREEGEFRNDGGITVAASDLAERLVRSDCIAQPKLANHPAVAPITNGALASLRIVTGTRGGRAIAIAAMLYLPSGNRITSTAGIGCSIDLDSGALTRALDFPNQGRPIVSHPDTGAAINGRVLPFWPESMRLATDAHERAFERFAFLGWDIALTEDGPLLLEANIGWVALHLQRLNGPLGLTEFGRVLETYV